MNEVIDLHPLSPCVMDGSPKNFMDKFDIKSDGAKMVLQLVESLMFTDTPKASASTPG